MIRPWIKAVMRVGRSQWSLLNGALLFYTCVPLPQRWPVEFGQIARMVPVVGLGLGGFLALVDLALSLGVPLLLRSTLVILMGLWLTGGLHMDGAMDTADGLAVQAVPAQRRLEVMVDSHTGAFGVMAAIAILLLKIVALATIINDRWFALMAAAAWGRWGQQWAIGCYPYLKPRGKGAFHKQAIPSCRQAMPWAVGLSVLSASGAALEWISWSDGLVAAVVGLGSAGIVAGWLNHKLGGHTGDTYGAVVEWVEVAILVGLACISQ